MKSFSLAELVQASGLSVDTIRYYQNLELLPGPKRKGRMAVYKDSHLGRLRLIRSMSERGLPLKVIRDLIQRRKTDGINQALMVAVEESANQARYPSAEFAKLVGIPKGLLALLEGSELSAALKREAGTTLYSEADLQAARGVMRLLEYGVPITRLLDAAMKHHRATIDTVDEAIDLFDAYVRANQTDGSQVEGVVNAFRELLPLVVSLVAQHFHRLLVNRALTRLKQSGDEKTLRLAERTAGEVRLRLAVG